MESTPAPTDATSSLAASAASRHVVGDLFQGDIEVGQVQIGVKIVDALRIMTERRYSQLVVVEGTSLRGVFALRDLARVLVDIPALSVHELTVADAMDTTVPSVTVNHHLDDVLMLLAQHEALPVVSPRGIQAVVTYSDVLNHFHRVARKFILIEGIERALRELISLCAGANLPACIDGALAPKYRARDRPVPTGLLDMVFEDYVDIVSNRNNHTTYFQTLGIREHAQGKLGALKELRNLILHFRRDPTAGELESLRVTRRWLLDKLDRFRQGAEAGGVARE